MSPVEEPHPLSTCGFGDYGHASEWPQVADAVIAAAENVLNPVRIGPSWSRKHAGGAWSGLTAAQWAIVLAFCPHTPSRSPCGSAGSAALSQRQEPETNVVSRNNIPL